MSLGCWSQINLLVKINNERIKRQQQQQNKMLVKYKL